MFVLSMLNLIARPISNYSSNYDNSVNNLVEESSVPNLLSR